MTKRERIPKNYGKFVEGLYGEAPIAQLKKNPIVAPKPSLAFTVPLEWQEQCRLVSKVREMGYIIFAIPNDAKRSAWAGNRAKMTGLLPGCPDLFLAVPRGKYHGMFIEMKRAKGAAVTHDQRICIKNLNDAGYLAVVGFGYEQALQYVEEYLALLPLT